MIHIIFCQLLDTPPIVLELELDLDPFLSEPGFREVRLPLPAIVLELDLYPFLSSVGRSSV